MALLDVETYPIHGGHLLVSVRSTDGTDAGQSLAAFERALNHLTGDVVVDLADVQCCDRTLALALIRSHQAVAALGRRLVLVNVGSAVRHLLSAFAGSPFEPESTEPVPAES